jgi:hypothetical protein
LLRSQLVTHKIPFFIQHKLCLFDIHVWYIFLGSGCSGQETMFLFILNFSEFTPLWLSWSHMMIKNQKVSRLMEFYCPLVFLDIEIKKNSWWLKSIRLLFWWPNHFFLTNWASLFPNFFCLVRKIKKGQIFKNVFVL